MIGGNIIFTVMQIRIKPGSISHFGAEVRDKIDGEFKLEYNINLDALCFIAPKRYRKRHATVKVHTVQDNQPARWQVAMTRIIMLTLLINLMCSVGISRHFVIIFSNHFRYQSHRTAICLLCGWPNGEGVPQGPRTSRTH